MTASAMRATRRMYSTMLAPRSVLVNRAWSQVRTMNKRFILFAPLSCQPVPPRTVVLPHMNIGGAARDLAEPGCPRRHVRFESVSSATCAAERAPGLVELVVDLVL